MTKNATGSARKILIASANPLFGKGLHKIFQERWGDQAEVVGLTNSMAETLTAMETLHPDLVIVDYDDKNINRAEFLNHFVTGDRPMQVMLVSLRNSGAAVVYDRRTLTPSQAQDWLNLPQPFVVEPEPESNPVRSSQMKHFVIVAILVILLTIVSYIGLVNAPILPAQTSVQAGPIDDLFHLHYAAVAFLFSLILVFLVYSVVVFRRRKGESESGRHIRGNNRLEVVWTLIPLLAVLTVSFIGAQNIALTNRVEPDPLVINVIGGQWYWTYEYPGTGITSNELVVPVNKPLLLRMHSVDVIHSFWVPEWRVKQDLLPGENMIKELRVTPNQVGDFKNRCAEMCGVSHAYMESPVRVVEQADYDAWIAEQTAALTSDPVVYGQVLFTNQGCASCHSIDGTDGVGPSLQGLAGREEELADGTTVVADHDYILQSIVDPPSHVVAGFAGNIMPANYDEKLSEQDLEALVAYIETLK